MYEGNLSCTGEYSLIIIQGGPREEDGFSKFIAPLVLNKYHFYFYKIEGNIVFYSSSSIYF